MTEVNSLPCKQGRTLRVSPSLQSSRQMAQVSVVLLLFTQALLKAKLGRSSTACLFIVVGRVLFAACRRSRQFRAKRNAARTDIMTTRETNEITNTVPAVSSIEELIQHSPSSPWANFFKVSPAIFETNTACTWMPVESPTTASRTYPNHTKVGRIDYLFYCIIIKIIIAHS